MTDAPLLPPPPVPSDHGAGIGTPVPMPAIPPESGPALPPESGPAPVRLGGWPGVPLTSVSWGWRTALGFALLGIFLNWSITLPTGLPFVRGFANRALAGLPTAGRSAGVWAMVLLLSVVTYLVLLAPPLIGIRLKHARVAAAVGMRKARLWPVVGLVTAGVWIGYSVDIAYVIVISALKVKVPDTNAQLLSNGAKTPLGLLAVFLLVSVIAPVAEEMLFRGVVFSGLRDSWGEGWAIVVSSILFGVMHLQPAVMIPTAIVGVLLAAVFSMTRSLWASIALHSAYNTTIMVFGLLALRATGKL